MLRRLSVLLLMLASAPGFAGTACQSPSDDCVEVGKWRIGVALGAGVRTNPVIGKKDIPLVVLPEIHYQGERFFIQNLDFGAMLFENSRHQLNLLLTPGYDQIFFHRWSPGNFIINGRLAAGTSSAENSWLVPQQPLEAARAIDTSRLHKRRMAALAGLEYRLDGEQWFMQWQALQDISGVHEGQEVRASLTRQWRHKRHQLAVTGGASWQSARVIDYYFGIRPDEVHFSEDAYQAEQGVSTLVRFDWNYTLNSRWTLRTNASYKHLASEIRHSPLVTSDHVTTFFIGGVYHF